ncbi:long-chain-fatty-acid--CoA ligase [Streptomyces sp. JH14]|uniref:long-chain-fatty-acid--CoA ligase n=1 Tax=Streptomyces sp. JH14 TaxID=2793630 RepID=UPI0023F7F936|nr:long-chain-fatty-acid--CoA ligase [Streptomyces sp. JH14]MDF6043850.1 long-chain-fatty-acid--CoA ligase [Streptomyces sp. JH14]
MRELVTIDAVLARHAGHRPDRDAVRCEDRTVTYAELLGRSAQAARALAAGGAGQGTRVLYLGQESEYFYILLYACAQAGAVLVPVNWRLVAPEVEHILSDSGARYVFVEPDHAAVVERAAAGLAYAPVTVPVTAGAPGGGPAFAAWLEQAPPGDPVPSADTEAPLVQMYTSGTTGLPKGVVLAHRTFFQVRNALADAGLDWIDFRDADVSLIGVPGFHIGGLWWALQGLNAGVTNVSLRMFTGPDALAHVRDHRVTVACVVPAMLRLMLAERAATQEVFAGLRKVVYGGSPIGEALLEECLERIGCEFAQIYGLTESGNTSVCLPPAEHVVGGPRLSAAGRPYPGFVLEIRDDGGKPLPAREIGEVWIRTPAHMVEYWRLPEATEQTLVDGWLRTGDAGYLDEEGFLFICDRIKDTIIVAGENVYPAEIENVLSRHEAVVEAAVVGIPDQRWGEAVHAFVVLASGATASGRELMMFQRGRLADFKIPTSYSYLDRLPRNASGKILRRELREAFWQGETRHVN